MSRVDLPASPEQRWSGGANAPPSARGRAASTLVIVAILVVAIALRCWRLSWGLDEGIFFPDEKDIWGTYFFAFRQPALEALFGHTLNYPPLYGYVVGTGTALAYALGLLGPERDVPGAILIARGVSVAASVCTVLLVWRIGCRWFGSRAGAIAAALLAVTPFEVIQTHYASVDPLLGAWTALTLLFACRLAAEGTSGLAVASGVAAGLTLATKYPGAALAAAPAWAVLERAWRERSVRRLLVLGALALAGYVAAVVLACPPCTFESARLVREVSWLRHLATSGWAPANGFIVPWLGWYGQPYLYHLVAALPFALGWPLYVSALGGVVVALRRRSVADRVILASLLAYFFVMGRTSLAYPRYLIPLFAGLAILAGRALAELPSRRGLRAGCVAVVLAYSFLSTVSHVRRFSYDQQHEVARLLGRVAAARPGRPLRVGVPKSFGNYYALDRPLGAVGIVPQWSGDGAWLAEHPDAFILPEWLRISIARDRNEAAARDLAALESGAAGYVEALRVGSSYLDADLYTWLDPAFAGDLYIGEIGFRVYVRQPLLERLQPPAPG